MKDPTIVSPDIIAATERVRLALAKLIFTLDGMKDVHPLVRKQADNGREALKHWTPLPEPPEQQ